MALTIEELQRAWIEYKANKDSGARVKLIDHYSYLVKITAGRLVTSVPNGMDRDDLVSAGVIGLIKSVDQYDPASGVKFEIYAIVLIRRAILEMLRDEDWVPRSIRAKLKLLERTQQRLEIELNRPPKVRELADAMGMDESDVNELLVRAGRTNVYSLDDSLGTGPDGDDQVSFVESVSDASFVPAPMTTELLLATAMDALPPRERLVLALYYFDALTFKDIAKTIGTSVTGVKSIHERAISRLRTALGYHEASGQPVQAGLVRAKAARKVAASSDVTVPVAYRIIEEINAVSVSSTVRGWEIATPRSRVGEHTFLPVRIFLEAGTPDMYDTVARAVDALLLSSGLVQQGSTSLDARGTDLDDAAK